MNCQQPGCTGQIVEGYCDLCGMAPARASGSVPAHASAGAPPAGSASVANPSQATVSSLGGSRRSNTGRTPTSTRSRLGAGLVEIPSVAAVDPADALMPDPVVPEGRRFCGSCGEPVGRSRDGAPGRTSGFCRACGTPYSFEPKLRPGDVVAGQYVVTGALAHGGMGWVYLARDRNVSDRWVVLKGLLNTGDPDATAAALAERRFLAEVEHERIVKIYNFVEHESSGYIVMEYVGGRSLKQILTARREGNGGVPEPLPPAEAIAYMHEILPALGHLHHTGLLFCDVKVDNVIQTQSSLKLIDLGGVLRMDDPSSAVFGTVGYQAPEIATAGPSISSDLFTVARTLAVLCIDFRGYQGQHRFTLPGPEEVPLFARYDSLYRLLVRGTAPDPDDRFQSADEMREQLYGVLREVVADTEGRPVPAASSRFTEPLRASTERADWRTLPRPQVSPEDPSAGYLATIGAADPDALIAQLRAAPEQTVEVDLRVAAAMIDAGDPDGAGGVLSDIEGRYGRDWRVSWYRGVAALCRAAANAAVADFTLAYHAMPGELAPKLALALAHELGGDVARAATLYRVVAQIDPSVTSAAFGLARCRLALGDRAGALAAYDRVPDTSSGHLDAQTARIRCVTAADGGDPEPSELMAAGGLLERLPVDPEQRERLTAGLLAVGLRLAAAGKAANADGGAKLLGCRMDERDLRLGLERSLRSLARRTSERSERIRLVDEANRARPRTWT